MIVIAQVSDTHLDGGRRSTARARAVTRYLDELPYDFDAVLVTGDIADHGLAAEYADARKLLDLRHPVHVLPGNHDVRAEFRRGLLDRPASDGPINRVHRTPKAVFALCDSTIPGEDAGFLAEETLDWLAGVLGDTPSGTPVFVAFHHQPIVLNHPYLDTIGLRNPEPLADLVGAYPNVAAVLCGHAHAAVASTFAGRPLLVAPGVVSELRLPWEQGPEVADYDCPPSVAFHMLGDDGRLVTRYRVVSVRD
ncbi:metallophosphoesterase [Nonomuraea sp. NPDC000554]|uniref:metallophosphoesterase n=1 Tax=Nonomuraea sp. NPDC000554 TaxID=3154259 RepID=UPI00332DA414